MWYLFQLGLIVSITYVYASQILPVEEAGKAFPFAVLVTYVTTKLIGWSIDGIRKLFRWLRARKSARLTRTAQEPDEVLDPGSRRVGSRPPRLIP